MIKKNNNITLNGVEFIKGYYYRAEYCVNNDNYQQQPYINLGMYQDSKENVGVIKLHFSLPRTIDTVNESMPLTVNAIPVESLTDKKYKFTIFDNKQICEIHKIYRIEEVVAKRIGDGGRIKKSRKSRKSRKSIKSKKSRKQRGGGNNKLVKNCLDTFVKSKIEKEQETSKQFYDELEKILKMNAKKNKTLKKEDKEKIKKDLERIKKGRKMSKSRKNIESFKKLYTKLYCNPTCNGTMLESGNELSPEYYKAYKDNKQLINYDKSERKKIFGNKTNVLSDGFYEKAPKKYVDNIKKEGAISLCSPIVK
jgi:hypothetical protein